MSNWPVLNSELEYKFIDVSEDQNRRSEVWKYFWLDKKRAVARCKPCLDKGTSKILVVANGTTKSLQHHIDRCHKEKPNESKSSSVGQLSKTAHTFTKRKILGYHITKLAIQGISFRAISSKAMCELMLVLRKLFNALKCIPPTSVESERAFSITGQFATKLRTKLDDDTLSSLVFLKAFYKNEAPN